MADKYVKAIEPFTGAEEEGVKQDQMVPTMIDKAKKALGFKSKQAPIDRDILHQLNTPTVRNSGDIIRMTEKDRKIINSKEFKDADKRMTDKKKGGMIKKMASGGKVSQLAKANGCAVRGKTRGKIC
jgi:hypothetical protein